MDSVFTGLGSRVSNNLQITHFFSIKTRNIVMLGNFTFHNPTKLHFGEDSLSKLSEELQGYGARVMLV